MKIVTTLLSAVLFFSGCTSFTNNHSQGAGSLQLEIKQPITVPAGSSFAYIRARGRVVRRKEIGTYELYCKFLVPRPRDSAETVIYPDTFIIHGIHKYYSQLMQRNFVENQLAFNGRYIGHGNGGTQRDLELFFNISSANQPHVKSLSCIRFSDPIFYNIPTLEEVKELFGDLAEFKPVQG